MGATQAEIADIRQRDKIEQGITEEDERLAKQSILEHKTIKSGVTIVKSLTTHFSTITDQLFPFSKLLIHNDYELTCYGEGIQKLMEVTIEFTSSFNVYSGGGENGFWGISGGNINKKLINQIIKIFAMEPFSSHIFLFPFKFEVEIYKYKKEIYKNIKEEDKNIIFIDYLQREWQKKKEEGNNNDSEKSRQDQEKIDKEEKIFLYNEKKYFHEFVHKILFSDNENPPISNG